MKNIVVEHGYPSSFSRRESWKKISFYLFPEKTGTRIVSASSPIFWMPVEILVYLMIGFLVLLLISIHPLNSTLGNVAFIGLIVTTIIFEFYSYLHRKRDSFSEEVLRLLSQKQG